MLFQCRAVVLSFKADTPVWTQWLLTEQNAWKTLKHFLKININLVLNYWNISSFKNICQTFIPKNILIVVVVNQMHYKNTSSNHSLHVSSNRALNGFKLNRIIIFFGKNTFYNRKKILFLSLPYLCLNVFAVSIVYPCFPFCLFLLFPSFSYCLISDPLFTNPCVATCFS